MSKKIKFQRNLSMASLLMDEGATDEEVVKGLMKSGIRSRRHAIAIANNAKRVRNGEQPRRGKPMMTRITISAIKVEGGWKSRYLISSRKWNTVGGIHETKTAAWEAAFSEAVARDNGTGVA